MSALEKLECAKSALLLNDTDNYEQLMNDLSNQLNQQQTDQTLIALGRYVACWRAEYEQRMQQANHLKKSARGLIKEESFEQASNILVAALPLNSSDEEIPLLLLNCLTKAWPHGCSKKEVQDLVLRCRDLLLNTSAIYSANYQRHSHILASQLQINELLALRHENAAV